MTKPLGPSVASIKKAVQEMLRGRFKFAVLLGSAGTERFHSESDIDLAVYFDPPASFEELARWTGELSTHFNCDVDLVSLNSIDLIFARQVIETGRALATPDGSFYRLWVADQLSRYPDFKASRRVIETHLLQRKKYV